MNMIVKGQLRAVRIFIFVAYILVIALGGMVSFFAPNGSFFYAVASLPWTFLWNPRDTSDLSGMSYAMFSIVLNVTIFIASGNYLSEPEGDKK